MRDCEAVVELLAWHANGTLGAVDRHRVDSHTEVCHSCRTTLALERRIVESMRAPRDNVEQSPHAGWRNLAAQLHEAATPPAAMPNAPRRSRWAVVLGVAVAVQAAAIAVLSVTLVRHRQIEQAPRFHTLASPDPTLAAAGPLARIAFDSSVTEAAARTLAERATARIIAGPSPDNVYTFVFPPRSGTSTAVDEKVGWLRRQEHVLLVEPVVLGPAPVSTR